MGEEISIRGISHIKKKLQLDNDVLNKIFEKNPQFNGNVTKLVNKFMKDELGITNERKELITLAKTKIAEIEAEIIIMEKEKKIFEQFLKNISKGDDE